MIERFWRSSSMRISILNRTKHRGTWAKESDNTFYATIPSVLTLLFQMLLRKRCIVEMRRKRLEQNISPSPAREGLSGTTGTMELA